MPITDPRQTLEHLPDESIFTVARNPSAAHRALAIRILVERASLYAGHPDIAEEARDLVLEEPLVLKQLDPGSSVYALKLPGVIDVIADAQAKRIALSNVVAEHNAAHTQHIAAVESTVVTNKVAGEHALHDACVTLWQYVLHRAWQTAEDAAAQKVAFEAGIAELRSQHDKDLQVASERLRLLERSQWRKVADWCKERWTRLRRKSDIRQPLTNAKNQNSSIPRLTASACQRNGFGRHVPQAANRTAAKATLNPKEFARSNTAEYREDMPTSSRDAVANATPVSDKIE